MTKFLRGIPVLSTCGLALSCAGPMGPGGFAYGSTPDRSALEWVELDGLAAGATTLTGESFVVYSALGSTGADGEYEDDWNEGRALARADASGRFLCRPSWTHEDPAAEVSAYVHAMRYLDHYRGLGFAGFDAPVHLAVNFRPGGDGDFLAGATDIRGGPGIIVGQWGDRNLAYDPDVLGHELFHIVHANLTPADEREVENELDSLGMNTTPMAVAEAMADYFSCTLGGDPDVGEYAAAALGLPFLSTLANERRFPAGRTGQSHRDGQALSGALWEVRALIGAEVLDRTVWDTLRDLPAAVRLARAEDERVCTFPFVVERLLAHLPQDLDPGVRGRVEGILAARGLTVSSDVVTLAPDSPLALWIPAREDGYGNVAARAEGLPTPIQLRVDVPADAEAMEIAIRFEGEDDSSVEAPATLRVYVKSDGPVRWHARGRTIACEADWSAVPVDGVVALGIESIRALRGHAVFLSLTNASDDDHDAVVTMTVRRHD